MRPLSLSSRIVMGVLAVVCGSLVIFSVLVASFTRFEVIERLDNSLQEVEERLEFIVAKPDALSGGGQQVAHLPDVGQRTLAYQIASLDGRVELRSQNAPETLFVHDLKSGFQDQPNFRVYIRLSQGGTHYILVGEPTFHRQEAVRRAVLISILPMLAFLPVIWLLVRWIVRRALRPLARLQSEIRQRGSGNLSPVPPLDLPEELSAIHAALNLLLERLNMAMAAERAFAGNAAHELRNPLGALLAQAQVLRGELLNTPYAERVFTIVTQIRRLARSTEKLLQLSRANSGAALTGQTFDLLLVLRVLVEEMNSSGRIRILPGAPETLPMRGDLDAAAIMLRNMIENALIHASGEALVEIAVTPDGLRITNDCAPLDAETLEQIRKPFVRRNAETEGTGLGLAIVETIATQLGATLALVSPVPGRDRGVMVRLVLGA